MTSDDSDAITSYNLDDEPDDDLPKRSYWWSLHRPETWAVAALALACASLISLAPVQEIEQAIIFGTGSPSSEKESLLTVSGIRVGVALLVIVAAVVSIRAEDEDSTWSPPLARAAILLATLAGLLAVAAFIVTLTISDPSPNGF